MVTIWDGVDAYPELREYDWVRLTGEDGTVVKIVRLSCTSGRDGEWIRVKRARWHIADVRTVSELPVSWTSPSYTRSDLAQLLP